MEALDRTFANVCSLLISMSVVTMPLTEAV